MDGARLHLRASAGVAVAPDHAEDARALLQHADVALYSAKEERGRVAVYDAAHDVHSHARLALAGELRDALDDGGLVAYFQPQCDAATGAVVGLEALVRWRHPVRGLVPPDAFVPVAESTGLIGALTAQVLDQALDRARLLADAGHPLGVSVNLSARVLTDLDLPGVVAAALARAGVPAGRLTLEVTESMVMTDPARTAQVLDGLRALGVELSIDDFGTGYSSLVYLTRLRADELKIDKSFVMAMATSREDAVIVRSTIELGHGLGLRLVAEGVEDAHTWGLLRELGCDLVQGYHLSRPLPPQDVLPWVRRHELTRLVPAQPSPGGLPITTA